MHTALRWTAALSLGLVAACATGEAGPEETASRSETLRRDITLQTSAAAVVEVASPVELGRAEPPAPTVRRPRSTRRPAPAPSPDPEPDAAPTPEPVAVPVPVALAEVPAPVAPAPADDSRELAPGQTVTVLPASTGSASPGGSDAYLPAGASDGGFKPGSHCPHPPRRGGRPIGIIGYR